MIRPGRILLAALALAAAAQLPGWAAVPPPGQIRLASQTPWVTATGTFAMRIDVTTALAPKDVEVAVTVFRRVQSRSEFALTLQNRIRSGEISSTSYPLTELSADAAGSRSIQLTLQDPTKRDRAALPISTPGVYPVRVELRTASDGQVMDRFVTHLLYAVPPDSGGEKLGVALVLPVHGPPAIGPLGSRKLDPAAESGIDALAAALTAQPDVPVTLRPTPETLEALANGTEAQRATLAELVQATTGRQVVQAPYVPVSLPAIARGLDSELSEQLDRGSEVVEDALHLRPDPRVWVADEPVDETSLQRLRDRQADRLVLPDQNLAPIDLPVTPAQPFELAGRSVRRPALLASDSALAAHFDSTNPVLNAHQLLADLAVLYNDRPGKARAVVAVAPRSFLPSDEFMRTLMDGLAGSPIAAGITLDTAFAVPPMTTGRGAVVVRTLQPPGVASGLPVEQLQRTRQRVDGFASMLDSTNPIAETLDAELLAAESSELHPRQRTGYLDGIEAQIRRNVGLIQVPSRRTVTLTARTGQIPVTISSRASYPVHVQLRIDSDKLVFPKYGRSGSATIPVELSKPNTAVPIDVEARATGTFPLRLRLQSPDGALTLASARDTVRSTATSGVGILLTAAALGFLIVWWARHLARGRRNRRLVPA